MPWLNTETPITSYWFCTSGSFVSLPEHDLLRDEISGDFRVIADMHPRLAHLADVDVKVRAWSDFTNMMNECPPLRWRWFRGRPAGVCDFEIESHEGSFRHFLHSEGLPFFSRADFLTSGADLPIEDEAALLARLLEGNAEGVVIAGPGGVGKTRLALELGRRAQSQNWAAFRLDQNIQPSSIEELVSAYHKSARIILMIDYAEGTQRLEEVVTKISAINHEGGHQLRFIATCRASTLDRVNAAMGDSEATIVSLGGHAHSGEDKAVAAYAEWVVRRILSHGSVPGADDIVSVCNGMPALATFALFLWHHHRDQFDQQFRSLLGVADFEDWANRRLARTFPSDAGSDTVLRRTLAGLAASLSLARDDVVKIRGVDPDKAELLDRLIADRWIEENEVGDYVAAHDVFADAIIARFVFTPGIEPTARVSDLLSDAAARDGIPTTLNSIDRLASHRRFTEIQGRKALDDLDHIRPGSLVQCHEAVLRGRLLDELAKVRLLHDHTDVRDAAVEANTSGGTVSFLAEFIANKNIVEGKIDETMLADARRALGPILDASIATSYGAYNMILRRALLLDPDAYRERTLGWIYESPTLSATHWLLVAWVRSGLPPDEIAGQVATWLAARADQDLRGSFVLRGWLDAEGDIGVVEAGIKAWLAQHQTVLEAGFVYTAWLDARGAIDDFAPEILAWLELYGNEEDVDHVLRAWLEAGGPFANVSNCALEWFRQHAASESAVFLLKFIVQQRDLPTEIQDTVLRWCIGNASNFDAIWRISSFLRSHSSRDSDPEVMEASLLVLEQLDPGRLSAPPVQKLVTGARGLPEYAQLASFTLKILGSAHFCRRHHGAELLILDAIHTRLIRESGFYVSAAEWNLKPHNPEIVYHVADLINSGAIELPRDRRGLEAFVDWLRTWPEERLERLRPAVTRLRASAPAGPWNNLP